MNDFMRVLVLFDLPMITSNDRRIYSKFRKNLIRNGYMMLQFSVYSKICANRDSAVKHISKLGGLLPQRGSIRIMMITEKQYASMQVILGGKTKMEEKITIDPVSYF